MIRCEWRSNGPECRPPGVMVNWSSNDWWQWQSNVSTECSCRDSVSGCQHWSNGDIIYIYTSSTGTRQVLHWSTLCPVWAQELCRISPPCLLAECRKRSLSQGSFVLLYFALFASSELYLICVFLISLLSCIFQCEPTWIWHSALNVRVPWCQKVQMTA